MSETLLTSIIHSASLHPDAIAVRSEQGELTWGDLERRSNRLARRIRASKYWRDDAFIGVFAERSPELVVMLLAVLKAGVAYVPLDPAYPRERLRMVLADCGCRIVLAQPVLHGCDLLDEGMCIEVDGCACNATEETDAPLNVEIKPHGLAYAIYTSGSSGRPKGVKISHRALMNHMGWMNARFPLSRDDRVLQKTSVGFDAAVWEFWAPLMQGAQLVMARPGAQGDSAYLAEVLTRERITVLQLVPSMLEALLEEPAFCTNRTLRRVFCGGEVLFQTVARNFLTLLPAELINLYGPTETTIDATYWICSAQDTGLTAPIGHPIDGMRAFVLDPRGNPVPPGEAGELYLAGAGLASGYINLPEQSAQRFLPAIDGDGLMYRSGDNVRRLPGGELEFTGRSDQQIKLRGYRIELGEIEAVLKTHPMVSQAAVLVHGGRLCAWITGGLADLAVETIREHARTLLPDYMLPEVVQRIDVMPVLANGKLDRGALAQRAAVSMLTNNAITQPNTPTERALLEIWRDLLGHDAIGTDEDLFDIGGNSLIATRLAARIRKQFAIELPLRSVFEHRRIKALGKLIDSGTLEKATARLPRAASEAAAPLSFAQERVWIIQRMAPGNMAYAFRTVTRFTGNLDVRALRLTLAEIVRRHEIFRTTFPLRDGRPIQQVHAPWEPALDVVDVSGPDSKARAEARIADEFRKGFDLTQLPLVRWTLIRLSEREHLLAQIEHHLVHDGWSFNIYLREFKQLYEAFASGTGARLPELAHQFCDYATWEREWIRTSAQCATQSEYWREALAGAPPLLELDFARTRPSLPSYRGGLHRETVPAPVARELRALCKERGVTLFMAMLAVFKLLLCRHSGQHDILVGTGVANRRWFESEQMMGMMLNTLALRTSLRGGPTFYELLARVRESTIDAYANQDLPFQHVVNAASVPRDPRYNPVVQMMFNFHDAPLPHLDVGDLRVEVNDLMDNGSAKFDLSLIVIPRLERGVGMDVGQRDETILMIWEFSSDLFDRTQIEALARCYVAWVGLLARNPHLHLSDLDRDGALLAKREAEPQRNRHLREIFRL